MVEGAYCNIATQHATKKENRPGDNPLSDSWEGKVVPKEYLP